MTPALVTELSPLGVFATWLPERAVGDHDRNTLRLRLDPQARCGRVRAGHDGLGVSLTVHASRGYLGWGGSYRTRAASLPDQDLFRSGRSGGRRHFRFGALFHRALLPA